METLRKLSELFPDDVIYYDYGAAIFGYLSSASCLVVAAVLLVVEMSFIANSTVLLEVTYTTLVASWCVILSVIFIYRAAKANQLRKSFKTKVEYIE